MANNNWSINLIGGLDEQKTINQINSDVKKIQDKLNDVELNARFKNGTLSDLKQQLDTLQVELNNTSISQASLNNLVTQINNALQRINLGNINVGNINVGNVNNQAQQTGQQIGQQIVQGVSRGLGNNIRQQVDNLISDELNNSLNRITSQEIGLGFKVEETDSVEFNRAVDEEIKKIQQLNNKLTSVRYTTNTEQRPIEDNSGNLTGEYENIERLTGAVFRYNTETGEAITKTMKWAQIGTTVDDDGNDIPLMGWVQGLTTYNKSLEESASKTNTFAKQQSQAVANLTNQINQLNRSANDQNMSRPISDSSHLAQLQTEYNNIISAIQQMGNASSDTFTNEQNNVKTLISNYKSLVSEFRNEENVSIKMKGVDLQSGISIAQNDLEKFKADAKDFPEITQTINNLDTAIANVGNASSLNDFNDQLRVARAELSKIKAETSANNREEKVGINKSSLQSQIADLQRISPEIDQFEAEINGAKVTIQSLLTDLANVNTQSDFSVINSKWKAFTDSAKSAGIATSEIVSNSNSLAEKIAKIDFNIDTGTYEAKIADLTAKTQQWTEANGQARISVSDLDDAYNKLLNARTDQEKINAANKLDEEIKKTTNDIRKMNAEYAKDSQISSLHQQVQEFYDKNSKAHKKWGNDLKNILDKTGEGAILTKNQLATLTSEFRNIGNEARQANKLGLNFIDSVKQQASKFVQWFSITTVISSGIQEIRKMVDEVKELDNAIMDLTMATGYNKQEVKNLMDTYYKLGKQLGATVTDVAASADTWLRQGKSIEETNKLIEDSMILSKISGLSAEDSTKYLTSAMKGYKVATEDVIGVVDKLSAVDMASATDVGGLAEGMSEVAASADLAGVSMDKLLGYLAVVGETTQAGMSQTGTSFNAIFSRMGNIKLARLKDYQNSGEDLSNVETVLRGEGILLRDSANEFRNFGEVLDEVAGRWTSFSEVSQRAIASAFAG